MGPRADAAGIDVLRLSAEIACWLALCAIFLVPHLRHYRAPAPLATETIIHSKPGLRVGE